MCAHRAGHRNIRTAAIVKLTLNFANIHVHPFSSFRHFPSHPHCISATALDLLSHTPFRCAPRAYLNKLPGRFEKGEKILITDPMLATGGTMVQVTR